MHLKMVLKKWRLGLSGGVDSALVACIACDAFGPAECHSHFDAKPV